MASIEPGSSLVPGPASCPLREAHAHASLPAAPYMAQLPPGPAPCHSRCPYLSKVTTRDRATACLHCVAESRLRDRAWTHAVRRANGMHVNSKAVRTLGGENARASVKVGTLVLGLVGLAEYPHFEQYTSGNDQLYVRTRKIESEGAEARRQEKSGHGLDVVDD
ncbi:hypothetical protein BOTBODRAFT_146105 [Botryobasidium botryosum FD-172 SS1]|uniref:Uncharacterized protein n=1 Tax=Botryobasidium botryosum (strain FD-172 SS1) TaxID=930990 RepID=A0A067MPD6_BOTB1|nr:hypothetical protein BOTBODRAFT_146105 [Botryobasidium botryosum FD-172 SS1]